MSNPPPNRGYTLVEMLAVLALLSCILSIVGALLRRSLESYSQTMQRVTQLQTNDRWMARLRTEIHQSTEANISEDQESLNLILSSNESIRYFRDASSTMRQRTVAGRGLATEPYPSKTPLQFRRKEAATAPLIEVEADDGFKIRARIGVEPERLEVSE